MEFQLGLGLNIRNSILKEKNVIDQIPYYDSIYTDCYSSAILKLIGRKILGKELFCEWHLSHCNWIEAGFISINLLEHLSIRARSLAAIVGITQLYDQFGTNKNEYNYLINLLTKLLESPKIGDWHYSYAEIIPNSILQDEYTKANFENLNIGEYTKLKSLYEKSSPHILASINDLFEISTYDLYSSITNESQFTLNKLVDIYIRLIQNGIRPNHYNIDDFTSITNNNGWGKKINYFDFKEKKLGGK